MRDAFTWYLVVQVTALAVWPAVLRALAPLEDRGSGTVLLDNSDRRCFGHIPQSLRVPC